MPASSRGAASVAATQIPGGYESAASKAVVTARMYYLGNSVIQPIGPGSKEKKSALVALGRFVGLDLAHVSTKVECGRLIAAEIGVEWDDACVSTGDTITLIGLNRLVDGAAARHIASGVMPQRAFVRGLMSVTPAPKKSDLEEEDAMSNDVTELELGIAEQIVQLMQDGPVPEGITVARTVYFDGAGADGKWRTPLLAIQGWLHLPDEINATSTRTYDETLGEMLGIENFANTTEEDYEDYLSALESRLEQANELRAAFVYELENESEGSATLATASAHWEEAWSEAEESTEVETSGPIDAEADTWFITEFRALASEGDLNLSPSYQRADVWPMGDAQLLIESVLRGIPLPSVILLRRNEADGDHFEIIDGKQRLTAILRFIGAHPRAIAKVKTLAQRWGEDQDSLVATFQQNYPDFRKLWRKNEPETLTSGLEREYYFPFKTRAGDKSTLAGDLEQVRGCYYSQIRKIAIPVARGTKKVEDLFEKQTSKYRIPVIIYDAASARQIHEVFSLYNRQGKRLNAEEIRNAAFHELALMRALLVTSGDAKDVESVAPFLSPKWDDLRATAETLSDPTGAYAMPDAGYKRTKALSWIVAALLMEDDGVATRSTANHINALLRRVQESKCDRLRNEDLIVQLMALLNGAISAHEVVQGSGWDSKFKNAQGKGRWQELQLVATLIALSAAYAVRGRTLADEVYASTANIRAASTTWRRPTKTQSRQQWQFIGGVVRDLLTCLSVTVEQADTAVRDQFGTSGLSALTSLERLEWWVEA